MENSPKQYLYHRVPEDMTQNEEGKDVLYPLNVLKEKFPGLYEVKVQKYLDSDYRKSIPNRIIPELNVTWGDVVQLTAVHPEDLKKELVKAGFEPKELKFYQIDPDLLNKEDTKIFLYKDDLDKDDMENYESYNSKDLEKHSIMPNSTKQYFKETSDKKERPLLFVHIPHILHKGQIDVSDFPVISVSFNKDGE